MLLGFGGLEVGAVEGAEERDCRVVGGWGMLIGERFLSPCFGGLIGVGDIAGRVC